MASAGLEEFDDDRERFSGPERPRRSRTSPSPKKAGKARPARGERKAKSQSGIHQRRNKRESW